MKGKRWSYEEDRILKKLCSEKTAAELSEILGRSVPAINSHAFYLRSKGHDVQLIGYPKSNHKTKYDAETVELCRQLSDDGMPHWLIAEKLEIPRGTVHDWCAYRSRFRLSRCSSIGPRPPRR